MTKNQRQVSSARLEPFNNNRCNDWEDVKVCVALDGFREITDFSAESDAQLEAMEEKIKAEWGRGWRASYWQPIAGEARDTLFVLPVPQWFGGKACDLRFFAEIKSPVLLSEVC